MRYRFVHVVTLSVVLLTACKSKQQKSDDLQVQINSVTAQLSQDCPKFAPGSDGVAAAFGDAPSPQRQAQIDQQQKAVETKLNSPHCKELTAKQEALMRQAISSGGID